MPGPTRRTVIGSIPVILGATVAQRRSSAQTPAAGNPGGVPPVFGFVPAGVFDVEDAIETQVSFADLAAEIAHTGTTIPDSLSDDDPDRSAFSQALLAVGSGGTVFQYAYVDDWRGIHGFDIRDVDQVVEFGVPPGLVTLIRGRFDRDEIDAALADQGYQTIEIDGVDTWNRGDDYEVDLDQPISRYWLGRAQNIALLDDTLVFAGATSLLDQVIAATSGDVSLADDARLVSLFAADTGQLTSAIIFRGDAFLPGSGGVLPDLPDPTDGAPLLPPIGAALFGGTAGTGGGIEPGVDYETSPVDYTFGENQIRVVFADPSDSDAGREAVEQRLDDGRSLVTGQSWDDLFESVDVTADAPTGTITIHLPEWLPGQRMVSRLVFQRDVAFLACEEG